MFVIRQARLEDIGVLVKLAKMVHFINLPADKDIISAKVMRSRECFMRAAGAPVQDQPGTGPGNGSVAGLAGLGGRVRDSEMFMFVLEDTEAEVCLGTSQVIGHMGGPGDPNFSLKLNRKEFFSKTLQTGTSQITATLHADESGPTEIGGLILQLASRGHKLGRFLSLVRFHFMALHRQFFADRVIAEMMAPISMDGQNMLWEYLGRRFIPLSYTEADKHCQRSREFIAALLPREPIYLSLLPPEARDVVGRVGDETVPARRMLERLGFKYHDTVDPFDGGPHLEAATDDIEIVKKTRRVTLGPAVNAPKSSGRGFVSVLGADGEFRAIDTQYSLDSKGRLGISKAAMDHLGWEPGIEAGLTPMESGGAGPSRRRGAPARKARA